MEGKGTPNDQRLHSTKEAKFPGTWTEREESVSSHDRRFPDEVTQETPEPFVVTENEVKDLWHRLAKLLGKDVHPDNTSHMVDSFTVTKAAHGGLRAESCGRESGASESTEENRSGCGETP